MPRTRAPKLSALATSSRQLVDQVATATDQSPEAGLAWLMGHSSGAAINALEHGEFVEIFLQNIPLPTLDLSGMTRLRSLTVHGTATHELQLPREASLDRVAITSNTPRDRLERVDHLAVHTGLEFLMLQFRRLPALDLRGFAALKSLGLAGVEQVRLGSYPGLLGFTLEVVGIEDIDLEPSTELVLLAIERCPRLRRLRIGSDKVQRVLLSGCPALAQVHAPPAVLARSAALRRLAAAPVSPALETALRLHEKLRAHNLDSGTRAVLAVIRDEHCALATAQLAYWRLQPGFYQEFCELAEVPDHARDGWKVLTEIEQRAAEGQYHEVPAIAWSDEEHGWLVKQAPRRARVWEVPPVLLPPTRARPRGK